MPEEKVYEDDDVIVWETVRGQPGDDNYGIDRRYENKPGTPDFNRQAIEDAARNALASNRAFIGLAAPTNAQVVAQVKALTRQSIGVIRHLLNQFDATD